MRPIVQKQQQILKQNISRFENRATQISYSLNKIQYLLYNSHESEQNKEFVNNEYRFLKTLVAQVGEDLESFQKIQSLQQNSNNNKNFMSPLFNNNSQQGGMDDQIKVEEEDEDEKVSSQSKYDDIDEEEDDEYDEQQSQQKLNHNNLGVSTRKKNIEKDKHYSGSYNNNSNIRQNHHQNNYSSSVSESQNYLGTSRDNKEYGNNRQVRKKKYSSELRKKLVQEIAKKNLNYRKICKKYSINYGTAYYLINSIQKEQNEIAQQQQLQQQQQQQQQQQDQQQSLNQQNDGQVINSSSGQGHDNIIQKSQIQGFDTKISEQEASSQVNKSNPQGQTNNSQSPAINNQTQLANQSSNPASSSAGEKQSQGETGRNKYQEEFKQQLYVESLSGLSYKDLSDKYKVSYETCYYLINTIKNQASKDSQLNKQLKAQIAEFKETLEQNKTNQSQSSGNNVKQNKPSNIIPTSTTLTRAQQAILNGSGNNNNNNNSHGQGVESTKNKEIMINSGDENSSEIQINDKNNFDDSKQKVNEDPNNLKIYQVLQVEEEENHSDNNNNNDQNEQMINEDNEHDEIIQSNNLEQNINNNDGDDDLKEEKSKKAKNEQDQKKESSQSSVKTSGSTEEQNHTTQ